MKSRNNNAASKMLALPCRDVRLRTAKPKVELTRHISARDGSVDLTPSSLCVSRRTLRVVRQRSVVVARGNRCCLFVRRKTRRSCGEA